MPMIPLIGQTYELRQKNLSSQRTINFNLRAFKDNAGTKSSMVMEPTQGATVKCNMDNFVTDPLSYCRGLYLSSSGDGAQKAPRLYGVWGREVFRFNIGNTIAWKIGTVSNNGQPVSMTDNGFEFVIVDGNAMFKYPLDAGDGDGSQLEGVTLPHVAGETTLRVRPSTVVFLKQRLIINSGISNQWYYSNLPTQDAPISFDDLNFYSAEQSSDPITGLRVNNGYLWVFGYRSYEVWAGTDNQDDPFSFTAGSQASIGLQATDSLATVNNQVFWLGASDVGSSGVYMGNGTSAERVSTPAIEDAISNLTNQANAIGYAYSWKGQTFYVISFKGDERTFVYEITTNTWTERLGRDPESGEWRVYPYQFITFSNGKLYAGLISGAARLCEMSDTTYTEWDGSQVVRQRISPVYFDNMVNVQGRELSVDMEVGTTPLLVGYGYDPQIMLEVSKDGGRTYGNIKKKSIGKQGQYLKVVRWIGEIGTARNFVFRLTITEPVSCSIYQARFDYSPCGRN